MVFFGQLGKHSQRSTGWERREWGGREAGAGGVHSTMKLPTAVVSGRLLLRGIWNGAQFLKVEVVWAGSGAAPDRAPIQIPSSGARRGRNWPRSWGIFFIEPEVEE